MTMQAPVAQVEPRVVGRAVVSVEVLAYIALLCIALILRAIRLGEPPLGDFEARQALAALHQIESGAPQGGAVESVLVFAGMVASFVLAGPSDAAARFLPMLGGVALTFSPLIFRERLGRAPTLITILLLTLSPTAVAVSRQVTGVGLAMLALIGGLAAVERYMASQRAGWVTVAGVMAGLAFLADYGSLLVIAAILCGLGFAVLTDEEGQISRAELRRVAQGVPWRLFFAGIAGAVIGVGTLFFLAPNGMGAAADQLARFADGVIHRPLGTPFIGLALLLHEPMIALFGLVGAWLFSQSPHPRQRFLAGWGVASIALSFLYPGALPVHNLWNVIPLAVLAGQAAHSLLAMEHHSPRWAIWGQIAAFLALLGMIFASLSRYLRAPQLVAATIPFTQTTVTLHIDLILLILWLILLAVLWLMVASLWGPAAAIRGTGTGILIAGMFLSAGQSGALAFYRAASPYELLNRAPAQPTLTALIETVELVGRLSTGDPHAASITVQSGPDSTLAWALRDYSDVTFTPMVSPAVQSAMVITPAEGASPDLGSSYVGQDFVVVRRWSPAGLSLGQFVEWMLYRTAPPDSAQEFRVILWVREDLFRLVPQSGEEP